MSNTYRHLLSAKRLKPDSRPKSRPIDDFNSDRSRIIYCSSFRRLMQKAQVFSLEPNASVRTRLTHSLEVADVGRTLATGIAYDLRRKGLITGDAVPWIVAIAENACLLHDIGNPPFGHFGEAAIKDWARNDVPGILAGKPELNTGLMDRLMGDFYEFDGNPQGFRTITRLHTERDRYSLNLTNSTMLCTLKYSRAASEPVFPDRPDITKKAGYFLSEQKLVEQMWQDMTMAPHTRYPLTYIMEAADDIAYCMSDIADGIEKGILTCGSFIEAFGDAWAEDFPGEKLPVRLPSGKEQASYKFDLSIPWSKAAVREAEENYMRHHDAVYAGVAGSLIESDTPMGRVLHTMKQVSRKKLYNSSDAESIELTGYAVITGILKRCERLLVMDRADFEKLVQEKSLPGFDMERRLVHRLGRRCLQAYRYGLEEYEADPDLDTRELWLRIHLLTDHIAGMTDEYALETYQALEGIRLAKL